MSGWPTLDGYLEGLLLEESVDFTSEDPKIAGRLKGLDLIYLQAVGAGKRSLAQEIRRQARNLKLQKE